MSGCSGNQAVAVSIRELSLGLVRSGELLRVWSKELAVGIVNGTALGCLVGLVAWVWKGNPALGAVVGGAMMLNTLIAVSIGGLQIQQGRDGSRDSGDVQVYSNIDGPDRVQLARLFVEQRFCSGSARVRVGKFDANDEFALVDAGVLHVHSSFGFTPTIAGFPSYPDPAFGALVDVGGGQGAYLRAAVMDGATQAGTATGPRGPRTVFGSPDGAFSVAETGFRYGGDVLQGRAAVGAWHHSGPFERADGATRDGLAGAFVNWEQRLP
jgi:carbohydrate-selective porin OprB